jgi:acetolactate synthase-1/2/3 large subunit
MVIDCDVPWFPSQGKPNDQAVIIQAGIDPLYGRYPIRGFPSDWTIQGSPQQILKSLLESMANHSGVDRQGIRARMDDLKKRHASTNVQGLKSNPNPSNGPTLEPLNVTHEISRIVDEETVIIDESISTQVNRIMHLPGSYFYSPHAGYLGWGLGAALGYKLGNPGKTVIATMGDGSYLFSVPSACHQVSQALEIPILIVIYNNQSYNTVKRTTKAIYPEGWSAENDLYPLTGLGSMAHYERICEAFGGYGERVESPDQVAPALQRALHAVKHEKRQAVLNMVIKPV